jgi:hypothetical protein
MGPIEMFVGWQALIVAAVASALAQAVKTVLDLAMTPERRKGSRWLNRVALPMVPVVVAALMAALVPVRPDTVLAYVTEHAIVGWQRTLVFAVWGVPCGMLADYLYTKLKDLVRAPGA